MAEMTIAEIFGLLKDGGTIAALLLIIVTGMRGDWVWKWYVLELHNRIDDLERKLDRALETAEKGAAQASKATDLVEREQRGRGVQ
jgi:hypothetical protein